MSTALIITDMLNRYEHEDADRLMSSVRGMLPALCDLIAHARACEILTIYVNDNHGDWSAGRAELAEWAMQGSDRSLVEPILPPADTPFIVKARHSTFYETQLEYLLRQERIERLVLAGQVTEQCILYSALDAYVRHFDVVIPQSVTAHIHEDLANAALRMMETNMRAEIVRDAGDVLASTENRAA
ncbi:MAG TPA: cysteine hydrolase [Solirubrobacteraceae bacterium]|jgi:nicotinamidase-related amidase|nr:cysteine hydrolase [Solirubrobacteraceae bacterium]